MMRLGWQMLWREMRSGELRLLFLALVVAVSAVSAVGFFTDRVRQALEQEARQLMGGDLLLIADHPWSAAVHREIRRRSLQMAETRIFPSMVMAGERAQLADVKAVTEGYPLRGSLRIARREYGNDEAVQGGPPAGKVWVDERLATALGVVPGSRLRVGLTELEVEAWLTLEPDRGVNFFSVAPRLLMNLADLPASGLLQTGSRVAYRLLVAGDQAAVEDLRQWLQTRLGRGEKLEDVGNARPEIRTALDRAQRFLGLSTVLTVVLATIAVALGARRYMQRHLDACAVMRCLGATQGKLVGLHVGMFVWVTLLAVAVGTLLGYGAHWGLHVWLAQLLATGLPPPTWRGGVQGGCVALVLLFGFALPPLLQLRHVPTLRVLRRELGPPALGSVAGFALGGLLLGGLIFWMAGDVRLGAYAVGGLFGLVAVMTLVSRGMVRLMGRSRRVGLGFGWRQGLANLERHGWSSAVQIVALTLGVTAMLLLTVVRSELLAAWQRATPPDAPNRFVINIQPDQVAELREQLAAGGVTAELAPMIRARLLRIDGREVSAASFPEDDRAQRLIEREFNLSWRADLPSGNRVSAGRWFAADEAGQGLASVEEGLAKTLGIRVGDALEFSVAGETIPVRVVGLRKLDWDSMRVNFFVLTPPGVLEGAPASYITSFYLPPGRETLTHQLIGRFPNLTVIDVAAIVRQLQSVIGQVAGAVQFVFLFTLAAGFMVLYAALMVAFDERRYELAVMRALGGRTAQLRRVLVVELAAVGALAGGIAALAAQGAGSLLASKVLQLELPLEPWLFPLAMGGTAALTVAMGWLAITRLLAIPPLNALRSGV